jgi:uncharacterized short protein YbdD (DUF466 family)
MTYLTKSKSQEDLETIFEAPELFVHEFFKEGEFKIDLATEEAIRDYPHLIKRLQNERDFYLQVLNKKWEQATKEFDEWLALFKKEMYDPFTKETDLPFDSDEYYKYLLELIKTKMLDMRTFDTVTMPFNDGEAPARFNSDGTARQLINLRRMHDLQNLNIVLDRMLLDQKWFCIKFHMFELRWNVLQATSVNGQGTAYTTKDAILEYLHQLERRLIIYIPSHEKYVEQLRNTQKNEYVKNMIHFLKDDLTQGAQFLSYKPMVVDEYGLLPQNLDRQFRCKFSVVVDGEEMFFVKRYY